MMASPNEPEKPPASAPNESQLQYDRIGSSYSQVKQLPTSRVETYNLLATVAPYLDSRNGKARVLDLACGTGHYSRELVSSWGAASVIGVDISPAMIKSAEEITASMFASQSPSSSKTGSSLETGDYKRKIRFMVGNAISMGKLDDRGFDLVIGAWLLNYSRSEDELVNMFRTISSNLNSEDGIFAGIVPPPAKKDQLATSADYVNKVIIPKATQPPWRFCVRYLEPLDQDDGGWKVQLSMFGAGGEETVKFETYHLPMETYERAARKGGMLGPLEWREVKRPAAVDGNSEDEELWDRYFQDIGEHFRVLVVGKSAAKGTCK